MGRAAGVQERSKHMIFKWISAGIFLVVGTYWDIREKRIPGVWIGLGLLLGLICMLYGYATGQGGAAESLSACLPGVLFLLIYAVTHEQMGSGDGMALLILAGFLGVRVWLIWLISLGGVFLFGVLLLVLKKGNGRTQIAYFPFLLMGYLLVAGGMG